MTRFSAILKRSLLPSLAGNKCCRISLLSWCVCFFSCASRAHCDHLNDAGAYFGFRCPSHLLPFVLKSRYIIVGKEKVNCSAAKTTNHCPAYTQSKALRCCTVVHVSCGQTKMAASSLLLNKKKSKSQCSSYTSDKPGCFSARAALDAMFFLCFFLPFTFRLEACAPPFFSRCCLFVRKTCVSLQMSHHCPVSLVLVFPCWRLLCSPRRPVDRAHCPCYRYLKALLTRSN